jgi:hypothetical protein
LHIAAKFVHRFGRRLTPKLKYDLAVATLLIGDKFANSPVNSPIGQTALMKWW